APGRSAPPPPEPRCRPATPPAPTPAPAAAAPSSRPVGVSPRSSTLLVAPPFEFRAPTIATSREASSLAIAAARASPMLPLLLEPAPFPPPLLWAAAFGASVAAAAVLAV